ncbi:MAG TPA: RNA polymerase sigma factor [Steroidobacteraceae bacterium]
MKPTQPIPQSDGPPRGSGDADDRTAVVARLFREHNRALVGYLVTRLKNEQEAKEVAQEAYVKILQLEQKPGAASFMRAYLFRVAANLAIDRIRQRQTRSRLDRLESIDDFFEEPVGERQVIAEQELALLRRAVAELPARCHQAFRMHKLEDRSFAEVAGLMRVTERMVRKFVSRALVYIRLRREGYSPEKAREMVNS